MKRVWLWYNASRYVYLGTWVLACGSGLVLVGGGGVVGWRRRIENNRQQIVLA